MIWVWTRSKIVAKVREHFLVQWVRAHLTAKLLILIFIIAVVPYAAVLWYSYISEQKLHTEKLLLEHREQMQKSVTAINTHFEQLYREIVFLAESEVMEAILERDKARRIERLLSRYEKIYDVRVKLLIIGSDETVVASTDPAERGLPYVYFPQFKSGLGDQYPRTVSEKVMLLDTPIHSAEMPERTIGYLIMEYQLSNLERFTFSDPEAATALLNKTSMKVMGSTHVPFGVNAQREQTQKNRDAIWMSATLAPMLPHWRLLYKIKQPEQDVAVQEFERLMFWMLLLGIFLIALAAYWVSHSVVRPLVLLQRRAAEMVGSQEYGRTVQVESDDEIGQLAITFNTVAAEIQDAFEQLRRENFFRLKRLTQMIGLFSRLLRTDKESECLKVALGQLNLIAPEYNVRFSRFSHNKELPSLYVYDFDHDTLKYYGSLIIPEGLVEEEQAFFRAIASMIAARIEQIRAFDRLHRDAAAKTAFISHLSHDLRTPLHAIMSQTQYLIGYGKLPTADMERVGAIENSAQQLLGMINDLLDLARLEAGRYEPELETISGTEVVEMVFEVISLLKPLAEQKELTLEPCEHIPEGSIVADRRFLRQIILNLLSNAVKYTDRGSIICRFEAMEEVLCLIVEDTGRGMSPETLQHVFEPFVQSEGEDRARGSGLGLALSRRFAQLFGAELVLFSDGLGQGSVARLCFTTL